MKTLIVGDVIGRVGRRTVKELLQKTIDYYKVDFVIANAENLAGGFGITRETVDEMFQMGADVLTSGNHVWDKKGGLKILETEPRIIRPANYPPGKVPGRGAEVYEKNDRMIGVINIMGRVFMNDYDDPFRVVDRELEWMCKETKLIFVDFHAEATSEKQAMGFHLAGRVTAVIGTHTHVQTADEKILDEKTAYITDVGMAGPVDSVIGMRKDEALKRFYTNMPQRFQEVAGGKGVMGAVLVEADDRTGHAKSIKRLSLNHEPQM